MCQGGEDVHVWRDSQNSQRPWNLGRPTSSVSSVPKK